MSIETPAAEHVRDLLADILDTNEDLSREGLRDTPDRMAKALMELTDGYETDPADLVKVFDAEEYDQIVMAKGIRFASLCEHHVLPFTGTVDVSYIPHKKIIGLSKMPRIVRALSRRLQVQERLTRQIADALTPMEARAVSVRIKAYHTCASLRGIETATEMVTHVTVGLFRDDPRARAELMELLR